MDTRLGRIHHQSGPWITFVLLEKSEPKICSEQRRLDPL